MNIKINYSYLFSLLALAFVMSSCKEDKLEGVEDIAGLGGEVIPPTAIDKYILDKIKK